MICAHVSIKKNEQCVPAETTSHIFLFLPGTTTKTTATVEKQAICANKNSLTHHYTVFGRFELAVYDEEVERG